jgi:hypothetical protein
MSRKVTLNIITKIIVKLEESVTVQEFVDELSGGYQSFHPQGAYITEEEIVDYDVIDSK